MPNNPTRSTTPEIELHEDNIFDLWITTDNKIEDDLLNCDEKLILSFTHQDNDIVLTEEITHSPKQLVDDKKENVVDDSLVKERAYSLIVKDKSAKSIMYYDIKLARVEIERDEQITTDSESVLSEHLEVIAKLDEDNPFDVDFDEPDDNVEEKNK